MSSNGIELATAWVRLVPSADGINENLTKALAPTEKVAEDVGAKSGRKWSKGIKLAIAGAGIAATAKALYSIGETFDDVTDTIRVGTGAQGKALDSLVASAENVGRDVPRSFKDIAPVVADLNTRLGLTGPVLEKVASQYLQAGKILGKDVDIQKTSAAFSAFQIKGEKVSAAMDTLYRVSQDTGVGIDELAAGVQGAAPALQTLGFNFDQSTALMGALDKAGLNSTAVLASMSKGLVTLSKDGEKPQEAFQRVTKELSGFIKAGDEAGALKLASKVFGTRGATQFVAALKSGSLNLEGLQKAAQGSGDTILGAARDTADFAEKWQLLVNNAMLAIKPLADAVFGALSDGLSWVMPGMKAIGDWMNRNPELVKGFATILGVLAGALGVAAAAQWVMNSALFASPITWIIVGLAAVTAAVVWLVQNWDTAVKFVTGIWNGFIGWITGVTNGFVGWWNGVWTGVGNWISGIWNGIASTASDIWNNGIVGPIKTAINSVSSVISTVLGSIKTAWNAAWKGMADFLGTVFQGAMGIIKAPINGIIGIINGAIDAINGISIDIPGWIPIIGGQHWGLDIPKIPALADGATVLPQRGGTMAVLAEAGKPETVVDTGLLNRALKEGLAGETRGYDGPLVNVEAGPGVDEQMIGRAAAETLAYLLADA